MSTDPTPIPYGVSQEWATSIKRVNLLEQGIVGADLHQWLENYADDPKLISRSLKDYYSNSKLFARYDMTIFSSPAFPELAQIKDIIIKQADLYVQETIVNPLPEHEKLAYLWFVIQHPNNLNEAVRPHYHELGDVALVYYLSEPSNDSGTLVMLDPRGTIERGGRALPRHDAILEYHPRRGDLLMIPRFLMHYTTVNTGTTDRKVLSATVVYDRPRHLKEPDVVKVSADKP